MFHLLNTYGYDISYLNLKGFNAMQYYSTLEENAEARRYLFVVVLTINLTFRESHVVNEVCFVLVAGVEGHGVVLDDPAVEDPLDSRDRVAGDLAVESCVGPRSANHLEILNRKFYQ